MKNILELLQANRKKIGIALVIIFAIMQFFPINKTQPEVDENMDFITMTQPDSSIAKMLKVACYDCHSHEVKFPWYTNVAPVSWWIKGHIDHGVEHLNFSTWGTYNDKKAHHKLEECYEMVEDKEMPLFSYLIAHSGARLSAEQRAELVKFFKEEMQ